MESAAKVAVRVWIKTQRPNENATEFAVVLIAAYVGGEIHRLWELTSLDWRTANAFKEYS